MMIGPITNAPKDQLGKQAQGLRDRCTSLFFELTMSPEHAKQTHLALAELKKIVIPLYPNPRLNPKALDFTPPILQIPLVESVLHMTSALRQNNLLRMPESYIVGSRTHPLLCPTNKNFEPSDVDVVAYITQPYFAQIEWIATQYICSKILERVPLFDKLCCGSKKETDKVVNNFISKYYLYKRRRFPRHDLPMGKSNLTDNETGSYYVCIGPDFVFAHDLRRRYVVSNIDCFRIGFESSKVFCVKDRMFYKSNQDAETSFLALQNRECRILGDPNTVFGLIFQLVKLALRWTISNLETVTPLALLQLREQHPIVEVEKDCTTFSTRFHQEQQNHVSKSEPEAWRLLHFLNCLFLILQGKDEEEKRGYVSALATAWDTHPAALKKQALAITLKSNPEQAHRLYAIVQGAFLYESIRYKSPLDVTFRPGIHFSLYRMHSGKTFHLLTNQRLHELAESFAEAWLQLEESFKDHSILTKILQELNMTPLEFTAEGKQSVIRILFPAYLNSVEITDLKPFLEWLGTNISRLEFPNETEEKELITYLQTLTKDDDRIHDCRSILTLTLQVIIERLCQRMKFSSLKSAQEVSILLYANKLTTKKYHKKIVQEIRSNLPIFAKQNTNFIKELIEAASPKIKKLEDSQNQNDIYEVLSMAAASPHCVSHQDSLANLYFALASHPTAGIEKCTQLGQQLFQAMEKLSKEQQSLPKLLLSEMRVALGTRNGNFFRIIFAVFQSLQETQKIAAKETAALSTQLESAKDISQVIPNFLQIVRLVDPKIEQHSKQALFKIMAPEESEGIFISLLKKQIEDKDLSAAYTTWEEGTKVFDARRYHMLLFALELLRELFLTEDVRAKKLIEFIHQAIDEWNKQITQISPEQSEKISHSIALTITTLSQSQHTFGHTVTIYTHSREHLLSLDDRTTCLQNIVTGATNEQDVHRVYQLLSQMMASNSSDSAVVIRSFAKLLNSPILNDIWNTSLENLTMHLIRISSQRFQLIDLMIQKNLFVKMSQENQDSLLKVTFDSENGLSFNQRWELFEKMVPANRLPYRYAFQHLSDSAAKATSEQISQYIQEAQRLWKKASEFLAPHDRFFARRVIVDLLLREKNEPSLLEASKHLLDADPKEDILKDCVTLVNRSIQLSSDISSLSIHQQIEKITASIFRYPMAKVSLEIPSILDSFVKSISKETPPEHILDRAYRFLYALSNARKEVHYSAITSCSNERTLLTKLTELFAQAQQYRRVVFFAQVANKLLKGKEKAVFDQVIEKITNDFFSLHINLPHLTSNDVLIRANLILPLFRRDPDKGRTLLEHLVEISLPSDNLTAVTAPIRQSISRLLTCKDSLSIFTHASLKGRTVRVLNPEELVHINQSRKRLEKMVMDAFFNAKEKEPGVGDFLHFKRYVSFANLKNSDEVSELITQLYKVFLRCIRSIPTRHSKDSFLLFAKFFKENVPNDHYCNAIIPLEKFIVTTVNILLFFPCILDFMNQTAFKDADSILQDMDATFTKKFNAARKEQWRIIRELKLDDAMVRDVQSFSIEERQNAHTEATSIRLFSAAYDFVDFCSQNLFYAEYMPISLLNLNRHITAFIHASKIPKGN